MVCGGIFFQFIYLFFLNFFSTFIYFWDRERQSMNGGGAEREGDTESETGSRLRSEERRVGKECRL